MLNRISVIGLLAAASLVFFTAGCRTNPQWDADNDRNDRNSRYVAGAEDDPGAGTAIAGPPVPCASTDLKVWHFSAVQAL